MAAAAIVHVTHIAALSRLLEIIIISIITIITMIEDLNIIMIDMAVVVEEIHVTRLKLVVRQPWLPHIAHREGEEDVGSLERSLCPTPKRKIRG